MQLYRLRSLISDTSLDAQEEPGDRWVTMHGAPVLIDGEDTVKAGAGVSEKLASKILKHYEEGEPFVDKGFMSTSTYHQVARRFSGDENKTVMHIKLPKGAKAVSIRDSAVDRSEHEILIARNRQYKITGVDRETPGTRKTSWRKHPLSWRS